MTTVLTYIIVLIVLASFFWSGYFFRIWQETKIQRRMWSNIVTRHNLDMDVSSSDSTEFTDLEIKNLKNELKVALLNEDYEEASKIRDLIRRLES